MPDIDWAGIRQEVLGTFTIAALPPTLSLPALPLAVTQFIEKSNNANVQLKQLASILETDTGLTLELLRYCNSTFVGLRHKVKGVLQALSILGLRQSRMFVISTGMQAAIQAKKSKLINQACFWNFTLQKALFAREVAGLMKADADMAFAGAMLQDFLLPVLTNDLCDAYLEFTNVRDAQQVSLCDFESRKFGWNHPLAAACLASRWGLPDDLVCCIAFHHFGLHMLAHPQLGRTAVAAVALSALLPDQLRQCHQGLEHLMLLQQKWQAFDLMKLAETVDEKHALIGVGVKNDFPLARRCKPALDGQVQPSEGVLAMA